MATEVEISFLGDNVTEGVDSFLITEVPPVIREPVESSAVEADFTDDEDDVMSAENRRTATVSCALLRRSRRYDLLQTCMYYLQKLMDVAVYERMEPVMNRSGRKQLLAVRKKYVDKKHKASSCRLKSDICESHIRQLQQTIVVLKNRMHSYRTVCI